MKQHAQAVLDRFENDAEKETSTIRAVLSQIGHRDKAMAEMPVEKSSGLPDIRDA